MMLAAERLHPTPILVIGIGNASRGDDAVGLVVAQHLRQATPGGVTVVEESGEGTRLMQAWQGAVSVVLIDAMHSGSPPGSVHRLEPLTQSLPQGAFPCSTHAFGVSAALALARVLQQLPAHLVLYGIEGKDFDMGRALSAEVAQAVPGVVAQIQQEIRALPTTT